MIVHDKYTNIFIYMHEEQNTATNSAQLLWFQPNSERIRCQRQYYERASC